MHAPRTVQEITFMKSKRKERIKRVPTNSYDPFAILPAALKAIWCTRGGNIDSRQLLTYRHRASSIEDTRFATLQRTLFIYLINKYISLSDICLTVHH